MPISVLVQGATGRMGREVLAALCREPDLVPVGGVARRAGEESLALPDGSRSIPFSSDLASLLERTHAQMVVDFSSAEGAMTAARVSLPRGVNLVSGSSGLTPGMLEEISSLAERHRTGAIWAANFTIGAVVMIYLAKLAARYFDWAEIIEMHHQGKADAPSGTALATARAMVAARGSSFQRARVEKETVPGSRGAEVGGISLHALRLPGLLAHQEVILGGPGQTLTLRHDTINRECYLPGILLAIREVAKYQRLVSGLDQLLGLD